MREVRREEKMNRGKSDRERNEMRENEIRREYYIEENGMRRDEELHESVCGVM